MKSTRKRLVRKTVAILIGLFLGWLAADVAFDQVPTAAAASAAPAAGGAVKADEHAEMHSMEALTLQGGKGYWFGKVVRVSLLLFLAAAVLGPVAMSLKSPEPPERDEPHGHDAKGHDGHAHAPHAAH